MHKSTSCYPKLSIDTTGNALVSQSGAVILIRTAEKTRLNTALSEALSPWRKPSAQHDPGKILLDLALSLAVGGDCLADIATLREQPAVFGSVASDATVSRLISTLAADGPTALTAINSARAVARKAAWSYAGEHAPDHHIDPQQPLVVDLDATLVTAHSEKENTAPNFKRGFGFHPLLAFVDHGEHGTGEPLSFLLRPGNSGSNTAADHIAVTRQALAQLPFRTSGAVGKKVLIRTDGAGGTHAFLEYLTARKLSYSVGFTLTDAMAEAIDEIPEDLWISALDSSGGVRDGAWVAELTGLVHLSGWPAGMRLIVRKERPHPGAQLRLTDRNGLRLTAFVTNTVVGSLQTLELRHRRRARCEDRIRTAKDTGLSNLPLYGFAHNEIWLAIVALASELTAWMQMLTLTSSDARRWEPKRLRLRLFSIAGRIARHARKTRLRVSGRAPWSGLITSALARLEALPAPT
ncbi:IS1380-like element IS1676 family transposase [Rhodococcus erythropolis]|uniref:IS1380-like element IS1676 family transposase n=1 Tax=Rhodococcus TaxID=1827 RepID=UPI000414E21E|nr:MULTISPECIES: IS1380-like element IS1676 family transposase [Rhodococcus]MBO8150660.1 IS1380-like element IS1676 family transposase [Rhodococcus erythropolis]MDO1492950.1 IS1380-like element IS1676 family transposase [Rhodococcus erythropolis]RGP42986.1 transposase [Rhodococcus erythropolis]GCB54833.1 IS1380 family transposase [Rhodococcus erythropolis]GCB56063.1 IS1380 family transposase [Rhodococcus erythropolis]